MALSMLICHLVKVRLDADLLLIHVADDLGKDEFFIRVAHVLDLENIVAELALELGKVTSKQDIIEGYVVINARLLPWLLCYCTTFIPTSHLMPAVKGVQVRFEGLQLVALHEGQLKPSNSANVQLL